MGMCFASVGWAAERQKLPKKKTTPTTAQPIEVTPPQSVDPAISDAWTRSAYIFEGTVLTQKIDHYAFYSIALVAIDGIWKGDLGLDPAVILDGEGGPTYAARVWEPGTVYLFYVDQPIPNSRPMTFEVKSAGRRIISAQQANADIEYFKSQKLQRTPPPLSMDVKDAWGQRWKTCTHDDECIVILGPCREWMALHRDVKDIAELYFAERSRAMECSDHTDTPQPSVACQKQLCEMVNPSSEDR